MYKNSGSSEYPTKNLGQIKNKFTNKLVINNKKSSNTNPAKSKSEIKEPS